MRRLGTVVFAFGLLGSLALGQSWSGAYEAALVSARAGDWMKAREGFKQAVAYRTEDVSGATLLPGPASEKKKWRDGSPYSPNFFSAYCAYRLANESRSGDQRSALLKTAADEFNSLINKGQVSYETVYYLGAVYTQLNDIQNQRALEARFAAMKSPPSWKVDTEIVSPDELAQIAQLSGREAPVKTFTPETVAGGGETKPPVTTNVGTGAPTVVGSRVPPIATKFALIVGNSECRIPGAALSFASDDAQYVRQALVTNGGYAEENVDLVLNATSAQLVASAKALADRLPDNATVFIFFAGAGMNIEGRDYFAGVDSESPTDAGSMVAKADLYKQFMSKGARIFAFFEANRPISGGRFFGSEVPMFGYIAQAQGTMPGQEVFSLVKNGRTVGAYADALASVLADFRTNRIPIAEFGWQVFYKIRRGDTGSKDGSSRQTPTLPVLTGLASDAKF